MRQEVIRRRDLPHWDVPQATYFVTTCLEGSIPARGLLDIEGYRSGLSERSRPPGVPDVRWAESLWKLSFVRTEKWLDPAARYLADHRLARIVVDAMFFFAGDRYDLLGYVVMPSHVHWVFRPREAWTESLGSGSQSRPPRQRIVHGLNRHTALRCNEILGRDGAFWQHESYDHWVRDEDELERILLYVESNPVKAGLANVPDEWPFSSAWERRQSNSPLGRPLSRRSSEG